MNCRALLAALIAVVVVASGCTTPTPDDETVTDASGDGATEPDAGSAPTKSVVPVPDATTLVTGDTITVAMVPKLKAIDYFNATEQGAKVAAAELGVELIYDGPIASRVEDQIELINSFITRKVDVIAVAPNDPDAIAAVLKRARDKGIHVITWDADANPEKSQREFFVDQASPQGIGASLVDVMAEEAGADAKTIVITGTLTAANQNEWMKWMRHRIDEKYPEMEILQVKASGEDQQRAKQVTQDVLTAHKDLDGIFAITSVAFPGAAAALERSGRVGEVALTGLSTPKSMRRWVDSGTVKTVVLWNAVDLGYLTIYAAQALCDGKLAPGITSIDAGTLGTKAVEDDRVVLGTPMRFTKENIGDYDF